GQPGMSSILDVMNTRAGIALWFILFLSIVAVGVAVERAIAQFQFTTRARALAQTVTRLLQRGSLADARSACERSPSPIADEFLEALTEMPAEAPSKKGAKDNDGDRDAA